MMRSRITVAGSSNTDMIIRVPILPQPGQTVVGDSFNILPGGKGANQAIAAARLGSEVTFITALGDDSFGQNTMRNFVDEGIDTKYVFRKTGIHSGIAMIYVDAKGENMIAVSPGANGLLSPPDIKNAEEAISLADMLILQLEMPMESAIEAAKIAKKNKRAVLLNPAPVSDRGIPDELLANTDIITPNRGELEMITGIRDETQKAAEYLMTKGPKTVVVTMGKNGAMAFNGKDKFSIPAIKVNAVDTVGAGDCFTAALGVSISHGDTLENAVRFAITASGLSTLSIGAQAGMPKLDNVMKRLPAD